MRRLYFRHVEGMRGATALYVLLYHLRDSVTGNPVLAQFVHATPFLGYGHYAVAIFIVISGYCLAAPVAQRLAMPFDVRAFAVRRFRRIYPAYAGALLLSIAAFFYWGAAEAHHVPPLKNILIASVTHALLVHNLNHKTNLYLNAPLWSVAVESQIYVVFALLLVPIWKRYGAGAQFGVALALGLLPHFLLNGKFDWTAPWFLGLFGMGVVAASIEGRPRSMVFMRGAAALALVGAVFLIVARGAAEDAGGYGQFMWCDLALGVALTLFLVSAADTEGRLWAAARIFAWSPIVWIGTFAYSIYLLHFVGIHVMREFLRRQDASPTETLVAYVLLVPVILAVSYGFYMVLERPFMSNFLRRYVDRTGDLPSSGELGPSKLLAKSTL